ncbi:MAG: hypothetical protein Q9P90_19640 [candidate division KSB1 bacterium]|nr:hypothetical protein [candidate division KSB1 bacterium]
MAYLRLNSIALANALGALEGIAISVATAILILQGESGEAFLSHFFPYYDISWRGAFIGLVAGFIDGWIGGLILAWVYNYFASRRTSS